MNPHSQLHENAQFMRGDRGVSRQRRRFRDLFVVLGFAVVLVGASLWIASKWASLREVGYAIVELRDETADLRAERDKLRAELAALSRPERILPKSLALGLRPLTRQQVVEVRFAKEVPLPADRGPDLVARLDDVERSR